MQKYQNLCLKEFYVVKNSEIQIAKYDKNTKLKSQFLKKKIHHNQVIVYERKIVFKKGEILANI